MKFTVINEDFQCTNCAAKVPKHPTSCRNHCNKCLYSMHLDLKMPGDRGSKCHGLMKPIGLDHSGKKGWMLIHKCQKCSHTIKNMTAEDDDQRVLIQISQNY